MDYFSVPSLEPPCRSMFIYLLKIVQTFKFLRNYRENHLTLPVFAKIIKIFACLVYEYLLLSSAYSRENFRKNKYFHNNFRENLQKYYVTRIYSQKWSRFHMLLTSFAFFNKLRKCQHSNIFVNIYTNIFGKIFVNIFAVFVYYREPCLRIWDNEPPISLRVIFVWPWWKLKRLSKGHN